MGLREAIDRHGSNLLIIEVGALAVVGQALVVDEPPTYVAIALAGVLVGGGLVIRDAQHKHREKVAREVQEVEATARAIAEAEEDELAACRTVAAGAREIMLKTPLVVDQDEQMAAIAAQPESTNVPLVTTWSVDAIVERGAVGLRGRVKWYDLEQALRSHGAQLTAYAGNYTDRMSREARGALESVTGAAEKAAEAARYGGSAAATAAAMPRYSGGDEPLPISAEEQRDRQDRLEYARTGFVLALQNLQGSIERLEWHGRHRPIDDEESAPPASS